ncbi:MAG: hypothetical protein HOO96_24255 [Polyangiaceae bacterium]|nr:hypothetical protein [Polyangiaceae bacterium]
MVRHRPGGRTAVAIMAAASTCAACSMLVDLASFTGGATPGSDAGSDAEARVPEGDAGGTDAGPDVPRIPFCAATDAAFCDDFDDGDLGATWSARTVDDASVQSKDTAQLRSPPASFLVAVAPRSGGVESYFEKDVAKSTERAVWAFDVRIDTTSLDTLRVATFRQPAIPAKVRVVLNGTPQRWGLMEVLENAGEGGADVVRTTTSTVAFTTSVWHSVALTVDLKGRTTQLTVDGTQIVSATLASAWVVGNVEGYLGIGSLNNPKSRWEIRYDNALLTLQ